jgi:hypothetical protein
MTAPMYVPAITRQLLRQREETHSAASRSNPDHLRISDKGVITDYAVYQPRPRDPQDADLILTVTHKNMAVFDDLQARTDPTAKKVFGSLAKAASASVDRGKMRKEVGSQMVRQLILK